MSKFLTLHTILLFVLSLFSSLAVKAHPSLFFSEQQADRLSISLQIDNDVPFSDEKYTSGIYITTELPASVNFMWHQNIRQQLNDFLLFNEDIFTHSQVGFSFFQQMYTPTRYWDKNLLQASRPFSAWLAAGFNYDFYSSEDLLNLSFSIGTFGNEWNFAEKFQNFAHTYVSPESPLGGGWRYQISGELAFNSQVNWQHQLIGLEIDRIQLFQLSSILQTELGLLRNSLHAGLIAHFGLKTLSLKGRPQYFRHTFFDQSLIYFFTKQMSAYLEIGILPEYVLHDSFVQGIPWTKNWHTVSQRDFQSHIWGGFKLQSGPLALSFFLNWKSPQTMLISDMGQVYWSFKISTLF